MGMLIAKIAGIALALVVSCGAVAMADVISQSPPTVAPSECVPGATIPANLPVNGPSPVGRCEPTSGQRLLDSAIWLFYLSLLIGLAVIGVVALVRSLRSHEAVAQ